MNKELALAKMQTAHGTIKFSKKRKTSSSSSSSPTSTSPTPPNPNPTTTTTTTTTTNPIFGNCLDVASFDKIGNRIGEGTYGAVDKVSERSERASLEENSSDESREMATDII